MVSTNDILLLDCLRQRLYISTLLHLQLQSRYWKPLLVLHLAGVIPVIFKENPSYKLKNRRLIFFVKNYATQKPNLKTSWEKQHIFWNSSRLKIRNKSIQSSKTRMQVPPPTFLKHFNEKKLTSMKVNAWPVRVTGPDFVPWTVNTLTAVHV